MNILYKLINGYLNEHSWYRSKPALHFGLFREKRNSDHKYTDFSLAENIQVLLENILRLILSRNQKAIVSCIKQR